MLGSVQCMLVKHFLFISLWYHADKDLTREDRGIMVLPDLFSFFFNFYFFILQFSELCPATVWADYGHAGGFILFSKQN